MQVQYLKEIISRINHIIEQIFATIEKWYDQLI